MFNLNYFDREFSTQDIWQVNQDFIKILKLDLYLMKIQ